MYLSLGKLHAGDYHAHWLLNVLAWPGQGIFMTSPDELHYELTTRGCYRMPSFFGGKVAKLVLG